MGTIKEGKEKSHVQNFLTYGEKPEQSQTQVLSSVPTFLIQEKSSVLLSSLAKTA